MSSWKTVKLSEVCEIQRGGSPRPIESFITEADDGINWIKIGDVAEGAKYITSTQEKIRPEGAQRSRSVSYGDFLLSNSMSFGRPYILHTNGCIHDGWLVLRYDKNKLTEDYLYHVLGSDFVYAQFVKFAVGAVVKNLNCEVVRQVTIPLPPIHEQRRIAAILDKADALRAKRGEALGKLEKLGQSIFVEMFGDPVRNHRGWRRQCLKQLGRVATGGTPPSSKQGMFDGEIPFVTPGDLGSKQPVKRTVTDEGAAEAATVRAGAALVCCIGATIGKMDKAKMHCAFNQQINAVEWGSDINDDYGISVLTFYKTTIAARGASTTLPILKKSSFEKIEIPVPPMELQSAFAQRVKAIEHLFTAFDSSISELDALFASLQQLAFRGEV